MDNLKRPAYPQPIAFSGDNATPQTAWGVHEDFAGFTKLEKAALILAAGDMNSVEAFKTDEAFGAYIVRLAKAVLEQANQ